jgi:SAM-dependent methyltransferase
MNKLFHTLFNQAVDYNIKNIQVLLEKNSAAVYTDLGCSDGKLTLFFAGRIGSKKILGVEIMPEFIKKAIQKGIRAYQADLNGTLPLRSESVDVVTTHQVIEHLTNSDMFLKEIFRILKPGGYAIISTENASSWCNILAALFGWQIFSLTNFSSLSQGIGNPVSIHRNDPQKNSGACHVRIYNFYGLKEYLVLSGFSVERILGSGYFPFPAWCGRLDPVHAHFITYKIKKPV